MSDPLDPSLLTDCRSAPRRPLTDPDLTHDWTPQCYPSGAIGGYYCPDCLIAGAPTSTLCPDRVAHVVAEVRRLTDPDMADRLRGLAADLAPFGCRPTMDAVKVIDYARVAIFDLIWERNSALIEVSRLTDANQRLTDLVRHQRSPLHDAELITDAEYADLAGLTGSPARLEGYDTLRGELVLQKRATSAAIGERDEARAALASIPWSRMEAWSHGHKARSVEIECPNGYGAGCWSVTLGHEHGITRAEEASFWTWPKEKGGEVAYRAEAEKSGVVFAKNIDDGRDWPGMDATATAALDAFDRGVWGPRDAARLPGDPDPTLQTALATARLDGARAMREAAASVCDAKAQWFATGPNAVTTTGMQWTAEDDARQIRALDPAAVVGSGS